jgi:hypothetical protein
VDRHAAPAKRSNGGSPLIPPSATHTNAGQELFLGFVAVLSWTDLEVVLLQQAAPPGNQDERVRSRVVIASPRGYAAGAPINKRWRDTVAAVAAWRFTFQANRSTPRGR